MDVPDISRRAFDDFTNRQGTYSFGVLLITPRLTHFPTSCRADRPRNFPGKTGRHIRRQSSIEAEPVFLIGVRYYWQNYFHDILGFRPAFELCLRSNRKKQNGDPWRRRHVLRSDRPFSYL